MYNKHCIIRHRYDYFGIADRSEAECRAYAKRHYPWMNLIYICSSLGFVAVFEDFSDFLRFCEFYSA